MLFATVNVPEAVDVLAIPTVNPPGKNYREICEYLSNRLERSGFHVNILRAEGALADSDRYPRYNLIARHEGTYSGQCIHFNSHIDVVNAGNGWTRDPFGGTIEGDKIFGRGSCAVSYTHLTLPTKRIV